MTDPETTVESLRLIAASNDANDQLRQPALASAASFDPAEASGAISQNASSYRVMGDRICTLLVRLTPDGLDVPDATYYEAAYEALATLSADTPIGPNTITRVLARALRLLLDPTDATPTTVATSAAEPAAEPEPQPEPSAESTSEADVIEYELDAEPFIDPEDIEDDHAGLDRVERLLADHALCQRVTAGDKEAIGEFYSKYGRLAWKYALKAAQRIRTGSEILQPGDLHQEIMLYFVDRAGKYDPSYDASFSSFACKYLLRSLGRVLQTQYAVAIPDNMRERIAKLYRLNRERKELGLQPLDDAGIATELDLEPGGPGASESGRLTVGDLKRALALTIRMRSLGGGSPGQGTWSSDYVDDGDMPLLIGTVPPRSVEEQGMDSLLRRALKTAFAEAQLSDRERRVMADLYNLGGSSIIRRAYIEVARMNPPITRERVMAIEKRVLEALKHSEALGGYAKED